MRRLGIINSHIASVLSTLGHTDTIVICDVGLPISNEYKRIDLAVKKGVPSFMDVLEEVHNDMVIESIVLAEEIKKNNTAIHQYILTLLKDCNIDYVSHAVFKAKTQSSKAIIRTGEITPYANIILQSGVFF